MIDKARVFQYNKTSILIEFNEEINQDLLNFILNLKESIIKNNHKQTLQVINTYNSLLIIYANTINNFYEAKNELLSIVSDTNISEEFTSSIKKIPVCYDGEFGWDLELLSANLNLSVDDIIDIHSQAIYTVYFVGFLPGFPYLGGLNSSLFHRRKSQPRRQIPAGSIGIADKQTGIYPTDSPGGWQLIGRSPVELFDQQNSDRLCYLEPGDRVQFERISKSDFEHYQSHS